MRTNPPALMIIIVAAAAAVFLLGAIFAASQVMTPATDQEGGTRTLADVVREDQPIAEAANSYAPCVAPTVQPAAAATIDSANQPSLTVTPTQPVATVVLPETQVLITDETFVGRQLTNELVQNSNPAYLGIVVQDILNCGSQIMEFAQGGPAASSALQVGDVIVAVNGATMSSLTQQESSRALEATPGQGEGSNAVGQSSAGVPFTPAMALFNQLHQQVPGVVVTLTIQRGSESYDVRVPVTEFPSGLLPTLGTG